jgi:hypothetical protein
VIRSKLSITFTALLFTLLSWHCTKINSTEIGNGLIPTVDNVTVFDTTLNVVGNNIDSIPFGKGCTTIYSTEDHVLGSITNDPLFGTTKATIYTELKPGQYPFYLPARPVDRTLDSIVLVLSYKRAFGDSSSPQTVEVHEITNKFVPDTSSCSSYAFNATILGSATYIPKRLADTAKGFRDTSANVLRIKLSSAFGQKFLAQDSSATSAFYSDSLFKVFLKGFAIIPGNSGNALSYFNLANVKTRLAVYYKYKRTGFADTAVVTNFGFNVLSYSANNIVRTHSGAEISQNTGPAPGGHNFIYIQTSPGSYAELKIPGLTTLSNRVIYKAELLMDQVPTTVSDPFAAPDFLYLDLKQNDTVYRPIPCDFLSINGSPDISSFGGYKTLIKDPSGNSVARYTFNLTRYVQKIVTNKRENSTLRLRAPDFVTSTTGFIDDCGQGQAPLAFALNNLAYGRVKLFGGTLTSVNTNRIRLRIIYSKL